VTEARRLEGRVTVVTGASRGIGAEIARLFAAEGARVICAARTLKEGEHPLEGSLETTVAAIRAAGGEARAVTANIAEPAQCEALMAAARAEYGPVDVLVNNAALTYYLPVAEYPLNKWLRSWAVNFHAPFVLCQLALADMIPRRRGAIVNISSGAAIGPGRGPYPDPAVGRRGGTCYGAEKAALERFSQGLASEVYEHGISVTCVSPSQVVPTPGTVHHRLVKGMDDPRGEPPLLMARAALLLATAPLDEVTGRVTYSQQILGEFGWITSGRGRGVETPGSGYSQI
jgi:NAD(P)-dependent dehydrogenase (short-subunit alcohol dehydrogenase family)